MERRTSEIWAEINGKRVLKALVFEDETGEDTLRYTSEWLHETRELHLRQMLVRSGLDPSVRSLSLDGYRGDDVPGNIPLLRKFIENFSSKMYQAHLYLWSRFNSTQKTTTSKIIAKDLLISGHSVNFITFGELSRTLKNQEYDEKDAETVTVCMNSDFLVIDDCFDPKKMTLFKSGYQLAFIDIFLRDRLETTKKSTCFTSNYPVSEIGDVFGVSLQALVERSVRSFEFNDCIDKIDLRNLWE